MDQTRQYVTFFLGGEYLGIDVLKVQEVVRWLPMTPVPRAPDDFAGLINLRGQIVSAVDLRTRLAQPARPPGSESMNVIVRTDSGLISLLVDEIGDVVEVPAHSFERPPENLIGPAGACISGVHKLPEALLAVLNVDRLTANQGGAP